MLQLAASSSIIVIILLYCVVYSLRTSFRVIKNHNLLCSQCSWFLTLFYLRGERKIYSAFKRCSYLRASTGFFVSYRYHCGNRTWLFQRIVTLDIAGLLFSSNGNDVRTAFLYEMDKNNNSSATVLKIYKHERTTDTTDSFEVYRNSKSIII